MTVKATPIHETAISNGRSETLKLHGGITARPIGTIPLLQEFFSTLFTIRQDAIASQPDDGYL
jgi:hypothetical protein